MAAVRGAQRAVAPAWATCFGCHLRDTELLIRKVFEEEEGGAAGGGRGDQRGGDGAAEGGGGAHREQQEERSGPPPRFFELELERFWASNVPLLMQFVAPHIRGLVTRVA